MLQIQYNLKFYTFRGPLAQSQQPKIYAFTWGDPKIPEIVKNIYLKCLYTFETLVHFEVFPLRLDSAIPFPLKILDNVSSLGAVMGLLHPVAGGVLRRGPKFQTCTNTLNTYF
jgi:hypothetical protein